MNKLKVAHYIYFDKKFIPQQIEFLNRHFTDNIDQTFFVHGAPDVYFADAPDNVIQLKKQTSLKFLIAAHLAERVIFNGLFSHNTVLSFAFMPWVLRKAIWLPWGGDLYNRNYLLSSNITKVSDWVKRQFVRSLYAIATPTLGDYETAKKWYGGRSKYIESGCNVFNFELEDLNRLVEERQDNKMPFRIQIGNSGDPTNEHLEILRVLGRFVEENIEVVAPLTYGNKDYIESVTKLGHDMFGTKFLPLTQFMSPSEYNKYLSTIDVVIMNHRRQQGFGNLVIALYLGSKIFIRREISTWDYLSSDMGCVLNDTGEISTHSFHGFVRNDTEVVNQNRGAVVHLFDRKWQKMMWKRLYFE
jgi:hypothetical protein